MAPNRTIFERLAGPPTAIREVPFTQAFAAVLEREPHLARAFGRWLFGERLNRSVDLTETLVTVQTEVSIAEGGRLDFLIEYRNPAGVVASIVGENKLEAPITNPLDAYRREVQGRQVRGEESALLLVSRRNAESDEELLPMWEWDSFLYLSWQQVYRWLKEWSAKVPDRWLVQEFVAYLEGMGLDNTGRFSERTSEIAALYTELVENMDKVLYDSVVWEAMQGLSAQRRNRIKEERGPNVHALYTFIHPDAGYIAAVGFAFTNHPAWQGVVDTTEPIVLFSAVGTTGQTIRELEECLAWLESRKRFGERIGSDHWHRLTDPGEYALLAWEPLTAFMKGEDHLSACRLYLVERIAQLRDVLRPVREQKRTKGLLGMAQAAAGVLEPAKGRRR